MDAAPATSPSATPVQAGFCKAYVPRPGLFDEMEWPDGSVRPHWQTFVHLLDAMGPGELERRWATARQLIHDNGVTYNVYGDPAGMDRPWNLDAIPFVLGGAEWAAVESGLVQRARLFDLILADLYGPQHLLKEGLLPPDLVFGHRGFLRPLHGVPVPLGRRLHFHAVDLARHAACDDTPGGGGGGGGGGMRVIADRTQAPSGAGYALENRLVVSRALPDVFRDCRVQRLAMFFRTCRDTLKALAPHNKENPRIVLLTPGPYNETYFEHAYLARYLGFTLVEGGDLAVRDNHVYLKTLGGLQQVDVILRRQDDDFCDPLELRGDSSLGVPGLVQAVHAGNVAVANALGSGLLESPALMMFLPRLCRHLLGEDLRIPSVSAHWCGDAEARRYVLDNLARMVIKPTFPHGGAGPIFCQTLTSDQLSELRDRISAAPRDFVGEDLIPLSTAPVLVGQRVEPRHIVLRAHLVASTESADGTHGYAVMPGGLTRFSATTDSLTVSMQRGGGSKDTWILTDGPVDTFSMLAPAGQPVDISRAGGDLPSRVADNLYWIGRYMDRAENLCRLARGITLRLTDQNFENSPELPLLLATLIREALAEKNPITPRPLTPEEHLAHILLDDQYPHGLQAALSAIYRIASLVRDRISADTWRIINRFERDFPAARDFTVHLNDILPALDRLIITFAAFGGLAMESMTRGYAWRFLDMGRRVERSLSTITLVRGTLVPVVERESPLLEAVLEVADSAMTYRRRYMSSLQNAPVLDLLLADESNPRSVAFQLVRLSEHIEALPHATAIISGGGAANRTPEERALLRFLTGLRLADWQAECRPVAPANGAAGMSRTRLDETLATLRDGVQALSDVLSQSYLSHAVASRQLSTNPRPPDPRPLEPSP